MPWSAVSSRKKRPVMRLPTSRPYRSGTTVTTVSISPEWIPSSSSARDRHPGGLLPFFTATSRSYNICHDRCMTRELQGPASQYYYSHRLRLHYVDWGNEGAPPLLLVHGGRDHCRNWDWVAQALRKDWHILAPDLRGHGDSQWVTGANYQIIDYVYDVAQLLHPRN